MSAPTLSARTPVEHVLGPVDQVPYGEGRAFDVAGQQVAVFRRRDGALRAVSAVCPHAGGPIADGQTDARVVICPLHLHTFELDTGCSPSGAPPLTTFDVRLEGEQIVVTTLPRIEEPR